MTDSLLKECLAYFQARPVYEIVFHKFREKYCSLGHFGGKITLTALSSEEKEQLSGFFQKDYKENKSITISASLMEQALAKSRFSVLNWEEILNAYYEEPLVTRKEQQQWEREQRNAYFSRILSPFEGTAGGTWLQEVLSEQKECYQMVMQQYKEQPDVLKDLLSTVLASISELPVVKQPKIASINLELLAVFSARTTGNPHYYDDGTPGEKLLVAFLKYYLRKDFPEASHRAEIKNQIFYEGGILKDDLSNDTLVYGIHAMGRDGEIHEGIEGFSTRKEPMKLTLSTLGGLKSVWSVSGNKVYVVENPAVFSMLIKKIPEAAIVCGNGQLRLATLLLLDLMAPNSIFYYSGDFDPEGLLIAQRLKERYGEGLVLWNYQVGLYTRYQSNVSLSETRLKKLKGIYLEELCEIKNALMANKKAAYQEAMMHEWNIFPG